MMPTKSFCDTTQYVFQLSSSPHTQGFICFLNASNIQQARGWEGKECGNSTDPQRVACVSLVLALLWISWQLFQFLWDMPLQKLCRAHAGHRGSLRALQLPPAVQVAEIPCLVPPNIHNVFPGNAVKCHNLHSAAGQQCLLGSVDSSPGSFQACQLCPAGSKAPLTHSQLEAAEKANCYVSVQVLGYNLVF